MRRSWFALPAMALIAILAAAPATLADGGGQAPPVGWSFTVTIDKTATPIYQSILLHVTGTYICATPVDSNGNDSYGAQFDPYQSNFGVNVYEIVGKNVVSGGNGFDGTWFSFNCDGSPHAWSTDLSGNLADGIPALWKTGKAMAQGGGQLCDTNGNCVGTGPQLVIMIKR